jgi:hypothetical protein
LCVKADVSTVSVVPLALLCIVRNSGCEHLAFGVGSSSQPVGCSLAFGAGCSSRPELHCA